MRTAYLILSHHKPAQVEALVGRILDLSPSGQVVVNYDSGAAKLPWNGVCPERVHLLDPSPAVWGDWSTIEASFRLLRFAHDVLDADWYVLISGEDRPIVNLAEWERQLDMSGLDAALVGSDAGKPDAPIGRRANERQRRSARYHHRWFLVPKIQNRHLRRVMWHLTALSQFCNPLFSMEYFWRRDSWLIGVRRLRGGLPQRWSIYMGSQWMALGRLGALAVLHADHAVVRHFRRTMLPDEAFFHTVLLNSDDLKIDSDRLLTYVPWAKGRARTGPELPVQGTTLVSKGGLYLRSEDFPDIRASGATFARKFDPSFDSHIVQLIDDWIDSSRSQQTDRPLRWTDEEAWQLAESQDAFDDDQRLQ